MYQDVSLEYNGNLILFKYLNASLHIGSPVIDPFCIVDMGLSTGDVLTVKVKIVKLYVDQRWC